MIEYVCDSRITADILEKEMKHILRFSGEKKKGASTIKLVASPFMLRRRRELSNEVMAGKFRVGLPDWEESRRRERGENPSVSAFGRRDRL
jgi:hypothetical protein